LGEVETVCDRVAIIADGEMKAQGTVQQIMGGCPTLEKAFLNIIGYPN
jgi:ABC-2 type transport system ATP-binding protein